MERLFVKVVTIKAEESLFLSQVPDEMERNYRTFSANWNLNRSYQIMIKSYQKYRGNGIRHKLLQSVTKCCKNIGCSLVVVQGVVILDVVLQVLPEQQVHLDCKVLQVQRYDFNIIGCNWYRNYWCKWTNRSCWTIFRSFLCDNPSSYIEYWDYHIKFFNDSDQ